jgi:hypothetical protein
MPYGTVNADVISTSVENTSLGAGNATRFKNRIINGDMRIDQRNAGAVQTFSTSAYSLDRFRFGLNNPTSINCQQVTDAPSGFVSSLKVTCISAVTPISSEQNQLKQNIEGYNWSDMNYGLSTAKTATFSFWVKSTLTGTFGGSFIGPDAVVSYPFSYTISSANTWEQKTITVAGYTTGTWNKTNGTGFVVCWDIGSGTNYEATANAWSSGTFNTPPSTVNINGTLNATWQITGVQLEVGTSATGFEYVDYGTQLVMCQRYCQKTPQSDLEFYGITQANNYFNFRLLVEMRTAPTITTQPTFTYNSNASGGSVSAQGLTNLLFAATISSNAYTRIRTTTNDGIISAEL